MLALPLIESLDRMAYSALRSVRAEARQFEARIWTLVFFLVAMSLFLAARLFFLQVLQHRHYHTQAESNRIRVAPIPPSRGLIFDRNGIVLAHNYTAYTLELRADQVPDVESTIDLLSRIIPISAKDKKGFYKIRKGTFNFETLPLKQRLSEEEIARIAANAYRLPGVEVKARLFREYPFKSLTSHAIGYIGRVSEKDLELIESQGKSAEYRGTTHMGKTGLEAFYEAELRGVTGVEEIEADSAGQAVRILKRTPPVPGNNLQLSLDVQLQELAYRLLGNNRGAVVAIDPRDGGVLALVSAPGFDPNLFIDGIDTQRWKALNESADRPLNNRAISSAYPPGSTFKPFIALAALEMGYRKPYDTILDPGYFTLPGSRHRFRDDKIYGHGSVDLSRSLVVSCDTYYYRLAHDMGIDAISRFLPKFSFGHLTGIDTKGEAAGVLPSKSWKKKRFSGPRYRSEHRKWYAGDTISIGIGQGYNAYTPLQLAHATAVLANDGLTFPPHLVKRIDEAQTGHSRIVVAAPTVRQHFTQHYINLVKEAMRQVVAPGGTAAAISHQLSYTMAGKTGTSQVIGIKQGEKYNAAKIAQHHRDHALFIAFAPVESPTIALVVLVENGGWGSATAAPIARQLIDFYLLGKLPRLPEEAEVATLQQQASTTREAEAEPL